MSVCRNLHMENSIVVELGETEQEQSVGGSRQR